MLVIQANGRGLVRISWRNGAQVNGRLTPHEARAAAGALVAAAQVADNDRLAVAANAGLPALRNFREAL